MTSRRAHQNPAEQIRSALERADLLQRRLKFHPVVAFYKDLWNATVIFYNRTQHRLIGEETKSAASHEKAEDQARTSDDLRLLKRVVRLEEKKKWMEQSLALLREYTALRFGMLIERVLKTLLNAYAESGGDTSTWPRKPISQYERGDIETAFKRAGVRLKRLPNYQSFVMLWNVYTSLKGAYAK